MYRLLLFSLLFFCAGCDPLKERPYKKVEVRKKLKAKHNEPESTNLKGDFVMVHYFLYDDNTIERVSLRDYMSFEVGDSVRWNEKVYE